MSYSYDYAYNDGNYTTFFSAYWILYLLITVFAVVCMWKIFEKAGKEGWKAIVPFLNLYTLFEITWGNGWLFLLCFVTIIPILGVIAFIVIMILTYVKLGKAFGKSGGFIAGLVLLSVVFMGILAFDSSTYLGVPKKDEATAKKDETAPAANPVPPVSNTEAPAPVETTKYCTNCGTALTGETAFCPNCGTPTAK